MSHKLSDDKPEKTIIGTLQRKKKDATKSKEGKIKEATGKANLAAISKAKADAKNFPVLFSVKSGLQSKCRHRVFFDQIKKDVKTISLWVVDASIYIHYRLYKDFQNSIFPTKAIEFRDYFLELQVITSKAAKKPYNCERDYEAMRTKVGLTKYTTKGNLIQDQINKYETAFKNNIVTHSYKRLRKISAKSTNRSLEG